MDGILGEEGEEEDGDFKPEEEGDDGVDVD